MRNRFLLVFWRQGSNLIFSSHAHSIVIRSHVHYPIFEDINEWKGHKGKLFFFSLIDATTAIKQWNQEKNEIATKIAIIVTYKVHSVHHKYIQRKNNKIESAKQWVRSQIEVKKMLLVLCAIACVNMFKVFEYSVLSAKENRKTNSSFDFILFYSFYRHIHTYAIPMYESAHYMHWNTFTSLWCWVRVCAIYLFISLSVAI